ncbi:MAG TPA: electron transport complex subunit E [Pseudomonadales bacterium]|nr:electron transport complex subunit E [Pseudomonadales bacterium]
MTLTKLTQNGLWHNNVALVQVLGLCPLLAVTSSVVNALGLGLATLVVLVASNGLVSLLRHHINDAIRLPVFVLIIAALTSCIEFVMQAYAYQLYQVLGIFIPLIVTNCSILARAETFARFNALLPSLIDGLMMGLGYVIVLLLLGAFREILGRGSLFSHMDLIFGPMAQNWTLHPFEHFPGILFLALPPGAFVGLGLLVALVNVINEKRQQAAQKDPTPVVSGHKRVRITGPAQDIDPQ